MQTKWRQYLTEQGKRHPSMEPRDVYKMMYQAAFGAEHLLQDKEAAWTYFQREYDMVAPREEALYEEISDELCRVNLRAWKRRNLPARWLFEMFVGSVSLRKQEDGEHYFAEYVDAATEAARENCFSFSADALIQYGQDYAMQGIRAVHHSENYRRAEEPAYRLVNRKYLRILPILEVMADAQNGYTEDRGKKDRLEKVHRSMIIAIDGRCASGKSTMAQMLSEITNAGVVHMDDFFLPMELRTKERLAEPGGNVHYERFREEVLEKLSGAEAFTYRRFDCGKMQLGEERRVEVSPFCIIEGAYSRHPFFGQYADVTVFSDVTPDVQLARIAMRDGEEVLSRFQERWIPMEEQYFASFQIREKSDLII